MRPAHDQCSATLQLDDVKRGHHISRNLFSSLRPSYPFSVIVLSSPLSVLLPSALYFSTLCPSYASRFRYNIPTHLTARPARSPFPDKTRVAILRPVTSRLAIKQFQKMRKLALCFWGTFPGIAGSGRPRTSDRVSFESRKARTNASEVVLEVSSPGAPANKRTKETCGISHHH